MPTNFSALDQNLPRFTGDETTERKVQVIQDYLYQLLEALRYAMSNLDTRNFNQTAWNKFLDGYGSGLTDPIYKQISDAEGNLTKLEVTAKGLQMQITNNAGDIHNLSVTAGELTSQIANNAGDISTLKQTAQSLSSTISNAQGDISTLRQTANSLTSQISSANGNISVLQQTANNLSVSISNAQNNIYNLQLTANSLTSQISSANGNISVLQQTANNLSVSISNAQNNIYNLQLTANGLSSTVADTQGRVSIVEQTVNGLTIYNPYTGQTQINGGMIETSQMRLDRLFGNSVFLMTPSGEIAAEIRTTGASTARTSFDLWARAVRINSNEGDLYLHSDMAFVTLAGAQGNTCIGNFYPNQGGMYSCGVGWSPWSDIYANNSMIQTSDREAKEDIVYGLTRYDALFDTLRPVSFRFRDGTSGRTHLGLISQDVEAALEAAGLTDVEFAGFVRSAEPEGKVRYGLRYGEFVAMLIEQVQALKARVSALEGVETL